MVDYCVLLHDMKICNLKRSYLTHYARYELNKFSQMLDNTIIYRLTQWYQCHTGVHVVR